MSIQWGFFFSFILSGSFFYNINPTTPLLNPPGAYSLFLTHLIEEGGGGLFEKGVGAYLTYYQFALKN